MDNHPHIVITRFPFESVLSGEEWHTITLAQELRRRGLQVSFLGSCRILLEAFRQHEIPVYPTWGGTLPVSKEALLRFIFTWPWIFFSLFIKIYTLHRKTPISCIYMLSLTEKVLLTPILKYMGIGVVWVEHQRFGTWFYKNPLLFFYRKWSKHVSIITVSEEHKQQLLKATIPSSQIHMITNGIDNDFFTHKKSTSQNDLFHIGTVARLSYDKGVDILIRSVHQLQKYIPNLHLSIMGEGPLKEEYKSLVHALEMDKLVTFLTPYVEYPREAMPTFYSSLSCFVLASRLHDPFGLVVAEALSCGVPTVVTSACGITAQLQQKSDAIIIPPDDRTALQSAIHELFLHPDLREAFAIQGPQTAQTHFSLQQMTDQYLPLLLSP